MESYSEPMTNVKVYLYKGNDKVTDTSKFLFETVTDGAGKYKF